MNRIKKIIIAVGILILLVFFWWLAGKNSNNNQTIINQITPTITPIPTINFTEEIDGATEITYTPQQQTIFKKMADLRDKLPISNDFFDLTFNYKTALFMVKFKENVIDKNLSFNQWLKENNYQDIPIENFVISK
jgi:hypothetical protein